MAPKHVNDLFSAAYDATLGVAQAEQFRAHLDGCPECMRAYDTFRTSVDAVRALPPARMPLPVHLPSDAPVAEQTLRARVRRMSRLGGPPRLRFAPGAATAVAAIAAAVIVVFALNHHSDGSTTFGTAQSGAAQGALSKTSAAPSCRPQALRAPSDFQVLAAYQYRVSKAEPGRPGQELVLATQSGSSVPGALVQVYAQLTVPQPSAGAPGAVSSGSTQRAANVVAVVPCVRVSDSSKFLSTAAQSPMSGLNASQGPSTHGASVAPATSEVIQSFTIPAGTQSGTVLHITATVPAGYPQAGDPAFTVDLAITVR